MLFKRTQSSSLRTAFTLVELVVTLSLMGVLGSIIYALGTEALTAFARNVSLNKSYTDARLSFGRIGNALQSAGQVPTPLKKDGTPDAGTGPYYYGVKFYRYGGTPTFAITSAINLSTSSLNIRGGTGQDVPMPGDIIVVPGIGFQAPIKANGVSGSNLNWTVSFTTSIKQNCAIYLQDNTATPPAADVAAANSCLLYRQVAFVVTDNPIAGRPMQLRYYPKADAAFDDPASYRVLAHLVPPPSSVPGGQSAAVTAAQNGKIFRPVSAAVAGSTSSTSLLQVTLCTELPDYDKRALGVNNYTQMQVTLGSRCPLTLTGTL